MISIKKLFHLSSKEKEKDDVEKLRGKLDTFLNSPIKEKKDLKKSIKKTRDEISKTLRNNSFIKLLKEYTEINRKSEEEVKPIIIREQNYNDLKYTLELSRLSFVRIRNKDYNLFISLQFDKFVLEIYGEGVLPIFIRYSYEDLNLVDFKLESLIIIEEKLKELLHILKDGRIFEEMNKKLLEILE